MKWCDWASDTIRYNEIVCSVKELDKDKVKKFLCAIQDRNINDYAHEMSVYANNVNEYFREQKTDIDNCVWSIDILENNGCWFPSKEGFKSCLETLSKESGVELLL